MMRIALFGAGRIGEVHARNIAANLRCRLAFVVDPDADAAARLADRYGGRPVAADTAMAAGQADAFIVASSTNTHAALLNALAPLGKPILCEKPVSLDFAEAEACAQRLDAADARCMMGFHRRYDPGFAEVRRRVQSGEAGRIFQLCIASRSWAPPPPDYIRQSGGLFRDQTIHDFDVARFLLGEPIASVYAVGGCMIDERIGALGDIDSAMVTLTAASGALVCICNGRFAAFGYDQRVEVFGTKATYVVGNVSADTVACGTADGWLSARPKATFAERYREAYERELDRFVDFAEGDEADIATHHDGLAAQALAEAALNSLQTRTPVEVFARAG